MHTQKLKLNDDEINKLLFEYKSGASMYALSKKYNVSVPSIKKYLKLKGVEIKQKEDFWEIKRKRNIKKILEYYEKNGYATQDKIAKDLKINIVSLRRYIHQIVKQKLTNVKIKINKKYN